MEVTRRSFLAWCAVSATAMGLSSKAVAEVMTDLSNSSGKPPVIWLQGAGCSGCSISLMNSIRETTIDDLLLNKISMEYHQTLMAASGDLAISALDKAAADYDGGFILVVEGAIPTLENGMHCVLTERDGNPWTMLDALKELAPKAATIVSVGTCASYGGIAGATPNPTGIQSVADIITPMGLDSKLINLPGCPAHPYTVTKTLIELLTTGVPDLDGERRPTSTYNHIIHMDCERHDTGFETKIGTPLCYGKIGCRGFRTTNSCATYKWNNQQNWCVGANNNCLGCASAAFGSYPFYTNGEFTAESNDSYENAKNGENEDSDGVYDRQRRRGENSQRRERRNSLYNVDAEEAMADLAL